MLFTRTNGLMLAALAAYASAREMGQNQLNEELRMGWKLGLRPRQDTAGGGEDLQFFDGSVGGISAPPVRNSPLGRASMADTPAFVVMWLLINGGMIDYTVG